MAHAPASPSARASRSCATSKTPLARSGGPKGPRSRHEVQQLLLDRLASRSALRGGLPCSGLASGRPLRRSLLRRSLTSRSPLGGGLLRRSLTSRSPLGGGLLRCLLGRSPLRGRPLRRSLLGRGLPCGGLPRSGLPRRYLAHSGLLGRRRLTRGGLPGRCGLPNGLLGSTALWVKNLLEGGGRCEPHAFRCSDLHRSTRLRVATGASGTCRGCERAEAEERDLIAPLRLGNHRVDHGRHGCLGTSFVEARHCGYF